MTARELALDSFWSERPLVRLYIERTGRYSFSLRELIAFAERLPTKTINRLTGDRRERSIAIRERTSRQIHRAAKQQAAAS